MCRPRPHGRHATRGDTEIRMPDARQRRVGAWRRRSCALVALVMLYEPCRHPLPSRPVICVQVHVISSDLSRVHVPLHPRRTAAARMWLPPPPRPARARACFAVGAPRSLSTPTPSPATPKLCRRRRRRKPPPPPPPRSLPTLCQRPCWPRHTGYTARLPPHVVHAHAHGRASGRTSMMRPLKSVSLNIWMAFAASRVVPSSTVP